MSTYSQSVQASEGDAHEKQDGNNFTYTGGSIKATSSITESLRFSCGCWFDNVTIPAGSTITAATMDLHVLTDDPDLDIRCEDADDPGHFSTNGDVIDRPATTAGTSWVDLNLGTGAVLTTPDFSSSVQEVINRGGWASGQAITVLFIGKNSGLDRVFRFASQNHSTHPAPAISITYTEPPSGAPVQAHTYQHRRSAT